MSQHIEEPLLKALGAAKATAKPCQGAKFHSPNALLVRTQTMADGSVIHLCGTCSDNYATLFSLMVQHEGALPWTIRREFGNAIRALARRGYEALQAQS